MLAGFQDALVALAADAALRRRFAAAPERALDAYDLDETERAALRAVAAEGGGLERYARSLVAKRWHELARVVPLTLRVAPGLGAYYRDWALAHPAQIGERAGEGERAGAGAGADADSLSPGVAEALRAEAAMRAALSDDAEAPYAAELWTFEVRRAAARAGVRVPDLESRFPIGEIAASVARGLLPTEPPSRPTRVRFPDSPPPSIHAAVAAAERRPPSPASPAAPATGFLGAGIGYRRAHREALLAAPPEARPAVLEVMPDHCFADPASIDELAARYPIVFHDTGLSLGTAGDPAAARARLRRIAALAARARPALLGEHLALTRSPAGIDLGHLAPLLLTRAQLDLLADRISAAQDALGIPIVLENIAAPLELPGADFTEPEALAHLADRTGCGVLLDLTNLLYTARNRGRSARELLRAYPLAAVRQVHLAGGHRAGGAWIDSHSTPVEDDAYALLADLTRAAPALRAIIIERDDKLPPLGELVGEAARAGRIWQDRQDPQDPKEQS